jgi:hypothetical protein
VAGGTKWYVVGVAQYGGATEAGKAAAWLNQFKLDHIDEVVPHENNHALSSTLYGSWGCNSQLDFEQHFESPDEETACNNYALIESAMYAGNTFEETGIGPTDCNTSFGYSSEE